MTKFDYEKICKDYLNKISPKDIIKKYNVSNTQLYRILKKNNIILFPKGYFLLNKPAWNKGIKMWEDRTHPCLGKHFSKEQKLLISKKTKKAMKRKEVKEKMSKWKGKKKPKLSEVKKKAYKDGTIKKYFGKENCMWKGGIYKLSQQIRMSRRYKEWRLSILERDKYICQDCGISLIETEKQVHHKITFKNLLENNKIKSYKQSLNCEELWELSNGISLCTDCHLKIHFY